MNWTAVGLCVYIPFRCIFSATPNFKHETSHFSTIMVTFGHRSPDHFPRSLGEHSGRAPWRRALAKHVFILDSAHGHDEQRVRRNTRARVATDQVFRHPLACLQTGARGADANAFSAHAEPIGVVQLASTENQFNQYCLAFHSTSWHDGKALDILHDEGHSGDGRQRQLWATATVRFYGECCKISGFRQGVCSVPYRMRHWFAHIDCLWWDQPAVLMLGVLSHQCWLVLRV